MRNAACGFTIAATAPEMPSPSLQTSLDNTHVEYRKVGHSGLRVSVPIFGCMSIGDSKAMPWTLEEEDALPLLKAAFDRGLNTWDTANVYSNGSSEAIVGKAIEKYQIPREKVVILTKCFWGVSECHDELHWTNRELFEPSKDYQNQYGLSRTAIFNQVDASLKRLNTSYIDLFQIHRFDTTTPMEETMKALHDLVEQGKVRYIGASSMYATQFARMQFVAERNGWTKFISMQNQYNMLYREEEREMIRFCNETGVGVIPWAPLCRGNLARPLQAKGSTDRSKLDDERLTTADRETIQRVEEVAARHGCPISHVSLAWILKRVTSPIIGFSKIERIDEAIKVRGKVLTEEEERYLEQPYQPKAYIAQETL
ncbi:putative aldo/keto reductase [Aureobasidium pullulans]|nr:putative aldo/keto reductase [Aureobasidium pullulans]THY05874.1 putative aldo/keto reductase [Aureobasidium pullulans]